MKGHVTNFRVLKEPAFWETAWLQARDASLFRTNKSLEEKVNSWNRRARSFKENTAGEKGRKRVENVLQWLDSQGVILDSVKVLDIGAGPGTFALAFAERAEEVVAVEPAEAMVSFLQEKIARQECRNIRVVAKTWEELDPNKEKWEDRFDLVFASMSPGINNWETLEKALCCANKYCYISSFAGKRKNDVLEELWPELFDEKMPPWPGDIIYLFNLLYAKGLELSFRVWEEKWSDNITSEAAITNMLETISMYGRDPLELEDKIKVFVGQRSQNGTFRQETVTRLGQILVKI
jgi:SAM-dependent methyltransferase